MREDDICHASVSSKLLENGNTVNTKIDSIKIALAEFQLEVKKGVWELKQDLEANKKTVTELILEVEARRQSNCDSTPPSSVPSEAQPQHGRT